MNEANRAAACLNNTARQNKHLIIETNLKIYKTRLIISRKQGQTER